MVLIDMHFFWSTPSRVVDDAWYVLLNKEVVNVISCDFRLIDKEALFIEKLSKMRKLIFVILWNDPNYFLWILKIAIASLRVAGE